MSWFTRFTRFGDMHMVFSQEAENSCGIACCRMVIFKVNKVKLDSSAFESEDTLDGAYGDIIKAKYDGSAYTFASKLAKLLNKFVPGNWTAENVGASNVAQALLDGVGKTANPSSLTEVIINNVKKISPIVVLVGWSTNGAHFVVIDTIHEVNGTLYASVCDPWDGDVHVTSFALCQPFNYTGASQPLSWNLGAAPEHKYATPSAGAGNGWIIRCL